MKIKTIKEYADEKGITTSGVRQLRKIEFVDLPTYVEYDGEKKVIGKQRFVKIN